MFLNLFNAFKRLGPYWLF